MTLKTLAKNTLRPLWTPVRHRIEDTVRAHAAELHARDRPLRSAPCKQEDFSSSWYQRWTQRIADGAPLLPADQQAVWGPVWAGMRGKWMHRKLWEWCAIAQALDERAMLAPGRKGLGFAVGREPLASLFAARGVQVLASDLAGPAADKGWEETGQLSASLEAVHWPGLISESDFISRVSYENLDMRDISAIAQDKFDFVWSSCSFEHLGNLEAGLKFVFAAMSKIKPGGLAVHTTEYNVSSNGETVETGPSVIYRQKDIEEFDRRLRSIGCAIEGLNFETGSDQHDIAFDYPPYYSSGRQHVKLQLDGHVSTSLLLVIRKAA